MHYVLIFGIIAFIIFKQGKVFLNTLHRLKEYDGIFPDEVAEKYKVERNGRIEPSSQIDKLQLKIDTIDRQINGNEYIDVSPNIAQLYEQRANLMAELQAEQGREQKMDTNIIWRRILDAINNYLDKNKGSVSDFHLIKDIVDRNTDTEEEAIQTQIPMPLYYGLAGTMAGIIVGVGYLWLSGGLSAILNTEFVDATSASDGITALLGGVAVAMIGSIVGIILTTWGSRLMKDKKIHVEQHKHQFLSWMQAELLPKLSNDAADVLNKVTSNLTNFNQSFADNARKLESALSQVNQATTGQANLLSAIENLKIARVVSANLEIYDKLKNCTDEIGLIAEQLQNSRQYLEEVRLLNQRLDASEQRTRAIEDMAVFFKEERANFNSMQAVINQTVGETQIKLKESVEKLKEVSTEQISQLVAHTTEQGQRLKAAIDEQDKVLSQKTAEISRLVSNLSDVENMVKVLDSSAKKQTQAISTLSQEIKSLAQQKASGTITLEREKMPLWVKVLLIAGGTIVSLYCLLALVLWIISLF